MKRAGIAYSILILIGTLFVVGIVWIGLYYGGINPIQNSLTGTYGSSIYDTQTLEFIDAVTLFWTFILTLEGLFWLWQQSQKPQGYN